MQSVVAQEVAPELPSEWRQRLNVVYFPQLGYLISLPMNDYMIETNDFEVDGLYFQVRSVRQVLDLLLKMGATKKFSTESTVYYKRWLRYLKIIAIDLNLGLPISDRMRGTIFHFPCRTRLTPIPHRRARWNPGRPALNYSRPRNRNHASTLWNCHRLPRMCIVDGTFLCWIGLVGLTYGNSDNLITTTNQSLLSFAQVARKNNYVKPIVTEDNVLEIHQGRHPLLEQCADILIPNDTELNIEKRLILLTGANSSGKSVYLKQVALIVYMAHIGSFVPAQSARIGLTDKILTRIATRESVSKNSSAFMIDLQQTNIALLNSTSKSLVLLDEFGKGTTSLDGIGLFCAVVESFTSRGQECPKVIAATHFHGGFFNF